MRLTEREHDVVTNIWGEETPVDLRALETEQLVAMHGRVSKAVQAAFDDDDVDSLAILLPLEGKIVHTLGNRL